MTFYISNVIFQAKFMLFIYNFIHILVSFISINITIYKLISKQSLIYINILYLLLITCNYKLNRKFYLLQ